MNHNFNIRKFSIESTDTGFLQFRMRNDDKKIEWDTSYYICKENLGIVLDSLSGKIKNPPYIDDGIYLMKFTPYGITSLELQDSRYVRRYFFIPSNVYIHVIERKILNPLESFEWSLDDETIQFLDWNLTPIGKIVYNGIDSDDTLLLKKTIARLCREIPYVRDAMIQFTRSNMLYSISHNKLVTTYIQWDSWNDRKQDNPSFYWYQLDSNGNRLINGGLIFHRDYKNGEYVESGHYSIHT